MNFKKLIQFPIFESRWLLMLFYLGLIAAQCLYCIKYVQTLGELFVHFYSMTTSDVLLAVLELLDMVLIANLIKMVISGSYQSFIEKLSNDHTEKVTSGALKIKMATSLVMVSGINLLQPFINTAGTPMRDIVIKCCLHLIFLTSAIGLAYIEYLHEKCKMFENPEKSLIKPIEL